MMCFSLCPDYRFDCPEIIVVSRPVNKIRPERQISPGFFPIFLRKTRMALYCDLRRLRKSQSDRIIICVIRASNNLTEL
jgi:hypothetical protein